MKLFIPFITLILFFPHSNQAQDKFAKSDQEIRKCIEKHNMQEIFGEDFSFSKWSSELRNNCNKVWKHGKESVLPKIAEQHKKVSALYKLSKSCPLLKKTERFLERMKAVYDKRVEEQHNTKITDDFEYNETYKVSLRKIDAYWIRWQLDAMRRRFD